MVNDIAEHLPKQSLTVSKIYAAYKKAGDSEEPRGYLGASIIGHPCERYLWYLFRDCCSSDISGRIYRLFATGDHEELRFLVDLDAIGCEVHSLNEDGKQFEISALGGHFSGHLDGAALNVLEAKKTWHVLEFKTHNAKSFKKLTKEGVKAFPMHVAQMQAYMHGTGMRRALYLAKNKDTDELYSERVHYDKKLAEELMERAERIITSNQLPDRIASRPDFYQCNWCDARAICWNDIESKSSLPVKTLSCRQCCHATPKLDGEARWVCEKHERTLSMDDQLKVCEDHLILPALITFAEAIDYRKDYGSNDYIVFMHGDQGQWTHGKGQEDFSSSELMVLPPSALIDNTILATKRLFGAVVVTYGEDILDRYPKEGSRVVWEGRLSELIAAWHQHYQEDLTELTAIANCSFPTHSVAEYDGDRIAIAYPMEKCAEIRERK